MSIKFLSFSKISWNYSQLQWFITVSRVFYKENLNSNLLCNSYFCKYGLARHCRHHNRCRNRISTKLGYICRCYRRIPFPDRMHDCLKWKWVIDKTFKLWKKICFQKMGQIGSQSSYVFQFSSKGKIAYKYSGSKLITIQIWAPV